MATCRSKRRSDQDNSHSVGAVLILRIRGPRAGPRRREQRHGQGSRQNSRMGPDRPRQPIVRDQNRRLTAGAVGLIQRPKEIHREKRPLGRTRSLCPLDARRGLTAQHADAGAVLPPPGGEGDRRNIIERSSLTNWLVALPTDTVFEKQSWQEDKPSRLGKNFPCLYSYTFAARVERAGHTATKIDVKPCPRFLRPRFSAFEVTPVDVTEASSLGTPNVLILWTRPALRNVTWPIGRRDGFGHPPLKTQQQPQRRAAY
jgi:hypothetical protein